MSNSSEVKSLKAPELAKEKALRVNTNMATMVQLELKCTAHCTLCPYETPKLESELAMWLHIITIILQQPHQPPHPTHP